MEYCGVLSSTEEYCVEYYGVLRGQKKEESTEAVWHENKINILR